MYPLPTTVQQRISYYQTIAKNLPLKRGALKSAELTLEGKFRPRILMVLSANDFLNLTTESAAHKYKIVRATTVPAENYKGGKYDAPAFFLIDKRGNVMGHEGRHRAASVISSRQSGPPMFTVAIYFCERYFHLGWKEKSGTKVLVKAKNFDTIKEAKEFKLSLRSNPNFVKFSEDSVNPEDKYLLGQLSSDDDIFVFFRLTDSVPELFPSSLQNQYDNGFSTSNFKIGQFKG